MLPERSSPEKTYLINPLQHLNGKFKRRTDVIGIFPNRGHLAPRRRAWAAQRGRYMSLELER